MKLQGCCKVAARRLQGCCNDVAGVNCRICSFQAPSGRQKRWQKSVLLRKLPIWQLPDAICSSKTLAKMCIVAEASDLAASKWHLVVKTLAKMCIIAQVADFAASKCHLDIKHVCRNLYYCVSCRFCSSQVPHCRQKRLQKDVLLLQWHMFR